MVGNSSLNLENFFLISIKNFFIFEIIVKNVCLVLIHLNAFYLSLLNSKYNVALNNFSQEL